MNIICEKKKLVNAINIVQKAITNRTSMPILECILLKAENNELFLYGTDLEIGIKSLTKANIKKEGLVALDSRIFSEIIRKLPDEEIEISVDSNNYTTIKCLNSEYKIMGQDGKEYPEIEQVETTNEINIKQNIFKNMIKQTIFSIALDESKPTLTGELLEIEEKEIRLISIDGYRISYRSNFLDKENNIKAIIPGKTMNELSKILSSDEEKEMKINITDKNILFTIDESIIVSRLLEGKFLDYKQNLSDEYSISMKANRISLLEAIERSSLISGVDKKQPIKLEVNNNKVIITSNASIGVGYEEVEVDITGDSLEIAFNPKYFIDALKVIEEEEVLITFNTSLSPCIIKSLNGKDYKYLILPVRLND